MYNLKKYLDLILFADAQIIHRPGQSLDISKRAKHPTFPNTVLSEALKDLSSQDLDWLKEELERSKQAEESIASEIAESFDHWGVKATATKLLQHAIEVAEAKKPPHTGNDWINRHEYNGLSQTISNNVYVMEIFLTEDWESSQSNPFPLPSFNVFWRISLNAISNYSSGLMAIAGQKKKFSDLSRAEGYIEKAKEINAALFMEINPPIPVKYAHLFSVNGVLLPGYKLEEAAMDEALPEAC